MDEYLSAFREMLSLRGLTAHTVKSYSTYICAYLNYLNDVLDKRPEAVSWAEMRGFIFWLQNERHLSDRTINACISQLRFFTIYILHMPWDPSQLPMRRFDEYLPYVPSKSEAVLFISSISDLKMKVLVCLLYSSGLRIGEACHLKYSDISRKDMRISISHSKNRSGRFQSDVQRKASHAILDCKTGKLGCNLSICEDCGHTQIHNNSCRNRNCPNCQAVKKELWVDKRRSEVIDTPYFHVVFTLPHELNPLLYCNQELLYSLFHKCCARTLLELSADKKFLGATPGIIQVLHTWNQELDYHVHIHCIISGGGLTTVGQIRRSNRHFFIPVFVLRDKFNGKFLFHLEKLYQNGQLCFSSSCEKFSNTYSWNEFRNRLYEKDWCPYVKETFNGFGNALEYLGRYTHKVAISNNRILSVTESEVTFHARGRKPGEPSREIT